MELITIKTFSRWEWNQASFAKSYLEANGIPAFLMDANTVELGAPVSYALGGIKLQVGEKDASIASQLLDEPQKK